MAHRSITRLTPWEGSRTASRAAPHHRPSGAPLPPRPRPLPGSGGCGWLPAAPGGHPEVDEADLRQPLAVVLGQRGKGGRPAPRRGAPTHRLRARPPPWPSLSEWAGKGGHLGASESQSATLGVLASQPLPSGGEGKARFMVGVKKIGGGSPPGGEGLWRASPPPKGKAPNK